VKRLDPVCVGRAVVGARHHYCENARKEFRFSGRKIFESNLPQK